MKRFLPLLMLSAVLSLPALAHPAAAPEPPEISALSDRPQAEKGNTMHYRNGTEAKLGDLVKGQPYNTSHPVVGTVVGLVPGFDSCNLRVAFLEVGPLGTMPTPQMALAAGACWQGQGTETEPGAAMFPCVDYGETKAFDLLARAGGAPAESRSLGGAPDRILQFFGYGHLPEKMQVISRPFGDLAHAIVEDVPSNPERTVALRKLLEAKDAAVRATIYKEPA